ncbi:GNAT family N-acetyltransferase [Oscillospiraceae bacterium HV4-5-C5C]|nr:GNAT family N-acetyltransferase [Oscillospiraceae bacterium HV4-5-C5C]
MNELQLMNFWHRLEALKMNTRHAWLHNGRRESVAEHCWRLGVMVDLLRPQLPASVDRDRILRLCLVHDWGEAITGDIPSFRKSAADEQTEQSAVLRLLQDLPAGQRQDYAALLAEFQAGQTREARLARALDQMEAVLQHNESELATWLPEEYDLNLTYGFEACQDLPELLPFRQLLRQETEQKIAAALDQGKTAFIPVRSPEQIEYTARLAAEIWTECYTELIGTPQVHYMLEQFQSVPAITRQIESQDYYYFLLLTPQGWAGYTALQPEASGRVFLSKFYLRRDFRGQGLAPLFLNYIDSFCRARGALRLWLTVNRGNQRALAFYQKMGFYLLDKQVTSIGSGYVMDDDWLQRDVPLLDQ